MDVTHAFAAVTGMVTTLVLKEPVSSLITWLLPSRKNGSNGKSGDRDVSFWQKDIRDGLREVQNESIVPALQVQNNILNQQTNLLTKAVTYLEILSRQSGK